ncbi:MAG: putative lipid II flippase FtsW [Gammaproteobacteria bacterium]|nr:putative lipid II flippase FtsW [Gammaproteobacteria bacterium]
MQGFKRAVVERQAPAMQLGVDQVLIICSLFLLVIGIVMVASASMGIADRQLGDPLQFVRRHTMYVGLGVLLAIMMQRIRLVHWEKSGATMVLFALFLLGIVLIPGLGRTVNGATRWLDLGVIGLQVSEPARLLLLVYLAGYLVRRGDEVRQSFQGFLKPMFLLGLACILILVEPDFGSAVVLLLTALGMMYLAGVRLWQFASLLLCASSVFAMLAVSSPYRLQRLTAFLDPWSDPFNTGFQLTQSLIAFGSGGWTGVGLGRSVQKLFYLPEAHNDFLFAILAEELGLIGVVLVLCLFGILVWRALVIAAQAERAGHLFAAYLAYGLALWFAIQSMINIGVNMGVLPTKGLTLPLVSAGGSSMLVMCAAIGLLLRINLETTLAHEQALRGDKQELKRLQPKKSKRGGS